MCLKRKAASPAKVACSGANDVLAGELLELGRHCRTRLRGRELDDRTAVKELALDRAPLQRVTGPG